MQFIKELGDLMMKDNTRDELKEKIISNFQNAMSALDTKSHCCKLIFRSTIR
jgi:hypothetical protein